MAEAELVEVVARSYKPRDLHQPPDKPWWKDIAYGSVRRHLLPRPGPALRSASFNLQAAGIVSKAFEHPFDLVKVGSVGLQDVVMVLTRGSLVSPRFGSRANRSTNRSSSTAHGIVWSRRLQRRVYAVSGG
jgi:hypothetical protein